MGDDRNFNGGIWDEKTSEGAGFTKPRFENVTRRTTLLTWQYRDTYPGCGGMAGLRKKYWRNAGFKKGKLDPRQTVILSVTFTAPACTDK